MTLPGTVREAVRSVIGRLGTRAEITAVTPVGGGCINNGARIDTSVGRPFFLKWNPSAPDGMFEAEMDGLRALRQAASAGGEPGSEGVADGDLLRIPEPYEAGGGPGTPHWLLMEWIEVGATTPDADERLGRGLALLHERGEPPRFGWHADNWIGSLPQSNTEHDSWPEFWRTERIEPQLRAARERGRFTDPLMDELLDRIPAALDGVDAPALLHGDLWSGNAYVAKDGAPVLVDPAVYRGDGEVDLAMSELFGGFGARFYDAYRETGGMTDEYGSHRRDLYQLYYLLVHVNLFGGGYVAGSRRAAERVLAAL
jgi:protein-ribulosamine 3-kinase